MKIGLVSPYDYDVPGGVGKHISALSRHFRLLGHEVRIIAPGSGEDLVEDQQDVYRIGRVTPVPGNGSVARITLSAPFGSRLSHRVRDVLNAEQFDVIHVHEPLMPSLPVTVLMSRSASAIKVGTFHAFRESYYGYYYGRPILKRVANRLHGRIAVSRSAYEFVSRYFPGTYSIIPNGVDTDIFNAAVEPFDFVADGRPTILFVGRVEKRKGLAYLIRAYGEIRQWYPNVRVLVVGRQGRAGRGYVRYVKEHGLTGIEFVGEVSSADLPRYYRSCDIFCAPSVSGESFGMVLLEAMAMGKPVVATTIGGYRQVVQDGVQGTLVEPRDSSALAAALLKQLDSPALRARLGKQGQLASARYSWQRISERLLRYYEDVRLGAVSSGWHGPLDLAATWRYPLTDELPVAFGLPDAAGQAQGQDWPRVASHGANVRRHRAKTTRRSVASSLAPLSPPGLVGARRATSRYAQARRAVRLLGRKN
jgi:phosphatidylinositol alpha-mannosyltransferase